MVSLVQNGNHYHLISGYVFLLWYIVVAEKVLTEVKRQVLIQGQLLTHPKIISEHFIDWHAINEPITQTICAIKLRFIRF